MDDLITIQDVRVESILGEVDDAIDTADMPITVVYACIRAAYGKGYTDALEDPFPDLEGGHLRERRAWALLP